MVHVQDLKEMLKCCKSYDLDLKQKELCSLKTDLDTVMSEYYQSLFEKQTQMVSVCAGSPDKPNLIITKSESLIDQRLISFNFSKERL